MIVVTGGSSAIGAAVIREALGRNLDLTQTTRNTASCSGPFFDLGGSGQFIFECKPSVIVHLAWDMNDRSGDGWKTNVDGSKKLIMEAHERGIKVIFLSSFSADASQTSRYGQMKKAVEEIVLQKKGVVIRAGIVWGDGAKGIFQTLSRLANNYFLCPHLYPDPLLFHTNINQLAVVIVDCALEKDVHRSQIRAASRMPIPLSEMLHKLSRKNHSRLHICLPFKVIKMLISVISRMSVSADHLSDSFSALELNNTENILADRNWEWSRNFRHIEFLQQ
jgi:nucleoside-diphosphate-sugar epimerase